MERRESVQGHLGSDPEMVYGVDGGIFTKFSICAEHFDTGKVWYNIMARANLADWTLEHLRKGMRVLVSGPVTQRAYTSSNGEARVARTMRTDHIQQGQTDVHLEVTSDLPVLRTEEQLARQRYDDLRAYPPRGMTAADFPEPRPEDLELTPHDEAIGRIQAIVAGLGAA